jgi:hypothetical protein
MDSGRKKEELQCGLLLGSQAVAPISHAADGI